MKKLGACSLLPREEARKIAPWPAILDQIKSEEEPIGTSGSACNHPNVMIQVLTFSQGTIDALRKRGKLEPVADIADEAYFYANPSGYAEVYARVGQHLVTVQKDGGSGAAADAAKTAAIALARAAVVRLKQGG